MNDNKYNPLRQWAFEVYGNFGRVIETFVIEENETHHAASERARIFCFKLNKEGRKAWVRLNTSYN